MGCSFLTVVFDLCQMTFRVFAGTQVCFGCWTWLPENDFGESWGKTYPIYPIASKQPFHVVTPAFFSGWAGVHSSRTWGSGSTQTCVFLWNYQLPRISDTWTCDMSVELTVTWGSSDSNLTTVLSACTVGDLGSIPGLGRSPGEGNSYPLLYSGPENSMDCIFHGVTKSRTQLSDFH